MEAIITVLTIVIIALLFVVSQQGRFITCLGKAQTNKILIALVLGALVCLAWIGIIMEVDPLSWSGQH